MDRLVAERLNISLGADRKALIRQACCWVNLISEELIGAAMKSAVIVALFVLGLFSSMQTGSAQNEPAAVEPDGQPAPTQGEGKKDGGEAQTEKAKPSELDLPEDLSIKIKVDPVIPGNVVDRIGEPAKVTVECPGIVSAEVFVVGVDSPYGGRALERPRLLGRDSSSSDGFTVQWNDAEVDQYVKIFAVVTRKTQPEKRMRSHTIDLAMHGARFKPSPAQTQPARP
jgi:hypothetical protein